MKRYRDIKLSTDVEETDDIYFEDDMMDFSYMPEDEGQEDDFGEGDFEEDSDLLAELADEDDEAGVGEDGDFPMDIEDSGEAGLEEDREMLMGADTE